MLKPQDIVVLLKLVALADAPWTIAALAEAVFLSASEVHAALSRLANAGLVTAERRPVRAAVKEFLSHGLRYAFAPERSGITRGVPTAHSHKAIQDSLNVADGGALVWPDPHGTVRGEGVAPLYKTAPQAALADERLHYLLALADLLRVGGARERRVAGELLQRALRGDEEAA